MKRCLQQLLTIWAYLLFQQKLYMMTFFICVKNTSVCSNDVGVAVYSHKARGAKLIIVVIIIIITTCVAQAVNPRLF